MKEIIYQNKSRIRSIIRKMTGSDNEDIKQEVYIKVWQNKEEYQEKGKFSQWINTITINLCRDFFRSKTYRQKQIEVQNEDLVLQDTSKNAEEIYDERKRQKMILNAVDELPYKLRQIVILFEFEELSYEQISKKTGLPIGTIKSRLFYARKTLSEKLKTLKGDIT